MYSVRVREFVKVSITEDLDPGRRSKMPRRGTSRDNFFPMYLDAKSYLAVLKLATDQEIGAIFACRLALNKGLYELGYIDEELYKAIFDKFSVRLEDRAGLEAAPLRGRKTKRVTERVTEETIDVEAPSTSTSAKTKPQTPTLTAEKDRGPSMELAALYIKKLLATVGAMDPEQRESAITFANKNPLAPGSRELLEKIGAINSQIDRNRSKTKLQSPT